MCRSIMKEKKLVLSLKRNITAQNFFYMKFKDGRLHVQGSER